MASDNVQLVLAGIEALNRRDVDGALVPFAEDVVYTAVDGHASRRGPVEMRAWLIEWLESWVEYHETVEDVLDLGDEVVLAVRTVGRGRASSVTVDTRHAEVHGFVDGRVARLKMYATLEAARAAVGLGAESPGGP